MCNVEVDLNQISMVSHENFSWFPSHLIRNLRTLGSFGGFSKEEEDRCQNEKHRRHKSLKIGHGGKRIYLFCNESIVRLSQETINQELVFERCLQYEPVLRKHFGTYFMPSTKHKLQLNAHAHESPQSWYHWVTFTRSRDF
jgi:hypothetical protein